MSPLAKRPVKKVVKKTATPPAKAPAAKSPAAGKPAVAKRPAPGAPAKAAPPKSPIRMGVSDEKLAPARAARAGLEGKINQDLINVIYKAADELGMPPWKLLTTAKLEGLVDDRSGAYTGPAIADLPGLTPEQKKVVQKVLDAYVRPKK